jgi:hypothetical protein
MSSTSSVATFTKKVKPLLFDYTLNNKILLRRSSVQDLGVLFDSKLSFCDHILSITSAAFKSLAFVLRSAKEFGDVVTLKLLYITYVRSKLEYASLVWSPIPGVPSLVSRRKITLKLNYIYMKAL